jgi:nucleoside-diphosphate-sugar epimerase
MTGTTNGVVNGVSNGHADHMYTPQRILITGGAGFIASHVTRRLLKEYPHYKVFCSRTLRTSLTCATLGECALLLPYGSPVSITSLARLCDRRFAVLQVIVLNNLAEVKDHPNFKVRTLK